MIPLRDANPARTTPIINYTIIGANVLAFLFEMSLGPDLQAFVLRFGVVPVRLTEAFQSYQVDVGALLPLFSSMFLHGGWLHLIGNMLFLHIFGDNVEDQLGHSRFLLFYLLSGVSAALTQVFINPGSGVPMVGASGAIAGVLGAYVLMFPHAKVLTVIPLFFFFQTAVLPAYVFLGLWFLLQVLSGMMSLGIGGDAGGVAWWAHIGGFACGALLTPLLRKRPRVA